MSANVLLNSLNELRKRDIMRCKARESIFCIVLEFHKLVFSHARIQKVWSEGVQL